MAPQAPRFNAHQDSLGRQIGHWQSTSTIDWCEQNYSHSFYIAEFWNTLSNLFFILPQLHLYYKLTQLTKQQKTINNDNTDRNNNDETASTSTRTKQNVDERDSSLVPRVDLRQAKINLLIQIIIGFGSFFFHMTLKKSMQILDETSMMLIALHFFYWAYILNYHNNNNSHTTMLKEGKVCCRSKNHLLIGVLVAYGLVFLALYTFFVDTPMFHNSAFFLIAYADSYLGFKLKQRDPQLYFWTYILLEHSAFALWIFDKNFCFELTYFRQTYVPFVLQPVFQLHAVWHLLMGMSSQLIVCSIIRHEYWLKRKQELQIRFKYFVWITLEIGSSEEKQTIGQQQQA